MQQKEEQFQRVLSQNKKLQKDNEDLNSHLEENIRKVAELDESSSLVAQQLKENAAKVEGELHSEIQTLVLEGERLKGRLMGVTTAQQCTRQHASSLEMALAQKEAQVSELERKMKMVVEGKEAEVLEYQEQLSNLQDDNSTLKAELEHLRTDRLLEKQQLKELERKLAEQSEELSPFTAKATTDETGELRRKSEELQQLNDDLQVSRMF